MTATGLPFFVTVTRSWVPATSSITWLKWALTAASDRVDMTIILVRKFCAVKEPSGRPHVEMCTGQAERTAGLSRWERRVCRLALQWWSEDARLDVKTTETVVAAASRGWSGLRDPPPRPTGAASGGCLSRARW